MRSLAILILTFALPGAASAGETTATLTIANMYCAICPITVRAAISKVPGVMTVSVDFDKKLAVVTFDDAIATVEELAAASRDAGFPAEPKQ
jgi:mercuric ion binding protein